MAPVFFKTTINAERYREIVELFITSLEPHERYNWFQQDGVTAHTAGETIDFLRSFFGNRLISRPLWPPRSPDLTPPDFYLWGYVKDRVFQDPPNSMENLKLAITQAIADIQPQTLRKVFTNMEKRVRACLREEGGHFEHML